VAVATIVGLHLHLFTPLSKTPRRPLPPTAKPSPPALRPGSGRAADFHLPLAALLYTLLVVVLLAVLWLEVLHPSRPWHTAVLGAALIAYLLAVHLAESGASPQALRPQVRVLAAGAALLALGAAAGMLPAAGPGAGSALLRLVAAGALIAAAGLVLPYVARDDTPPPPPA